MLLVIVIVCYFPFRAKKTNPRLRLKYPKKRTRGNLDLYLNIYIVPNLVSIQSTCAFSICMLLSICLCIYLPTSIHLASYQAQSMGICGSLHLLIHSQQGIQQTKWTGGQKKAERFKMVQSNAAKIHVGLISSHLAS